MEVWTYKLVKRHYQARRGISGGGLLLLEIYADGQPTCGLAIRSGRWYAALYGYARKGGGRRWEIENCGIDTLGKPWRDHSLRGWLAYYLLGSENEIDELARRLEKAAGLPDSGPHEAFDQTFSLEWQGGTEKVVEKWWRPVARAEKVAA